MMKLHLKNVELNVRLTVDHPSDITRPVVCLHGMTLSGRDWDPIRNHLEPERTLVAPDLIGHGQSESPADPHLYRIDPVVDQLIGMMEEVQLDSADWLGYSMGGRILLHLALNAPERVNSLVLESTTAGIEEADRRRERRKRDEKLAHFLETRGLETFVDRWLDAPVFESQRDLPAEKRQWARETRREADPGGLVKALKGLSRGRVPAVWNRLHEIDPPVLLITGEIDSKHRELHNRLENRLPDVRNEVVPDAGHNVHFERTDHFVELLRTFFRQTRT